MTRIDFYLLPDVDYVAKLRFACRLAHRAACTGKSVNVQTANATESEELDGLMWSYPPDNFLPHAVTTERTKNADVAVLISHHEPTPADDHVLINLSGEIPAFFGRFERVAEIILEPERSIGRDRYRNYRDKGYPLFHHDLDNWEEQ